MPPPQGGAGQRLVTSLVWVLVTNGALLAFDRLGVGDSLDRGSARLALLRLPARHGVAVRQGGSTGLWSFRAGKRRDIARIAFTHACAWGEACGACRVSNSVRAHARSEEGRGGRGWEGRRCTYKQPQQQAPSIAGHANPWAWCPSSIVVPGLQISAPPRPRTPPELTVPKSATAAETRLQLFSGAQM